MAMANGTDTPADGVATVIIGQHVRDEDAEAFEAWQTETNDAASGFPGFLGAEVTRPTAVQPDWTVVYRFDSVVHVQNWLNSAMRQDLLDRGAAYFDGPATQQVLAHGDQPSPPLLTVVVTHRVRKEDTAAFLEWQERLTAAEEEFPGFRGSEIYRPVAGLQDEWTTLYRFDSAATLNAWLTSRKRKQLLEEGKQFHDFKLRTIDNSFGNWFAFDQHGHEAPPPSNAKTSVAVWVGLYPTVMLLTLGLSALLPRLVLWQSLLIGNLLSSFAMSYVTMPRYGNPLLGWWLRPAPGAAQPRTNLLGLGLAIAVNLAWAIVFYLVTRRIWRLP
jgi:antibiotic biosynthesis monooxygenase (ABM) superfamily enzyme